MAPARLARNGVSQEELDRRKTVGVNAETITNTTSTDFPGHYLGEENTLSVDEFRNELNVKIHQSTSFDLSFSLIHVPASVANAFRRIMIATLPTIAIERVFIYNNTSVIQDEILAQRLGLIPLTGPSELLRRIHWPSPESISTDNADQVYRDSDTLVFRLKVECTRNEEAAKDEADPTVLYHNAHIYARDLVWVPQGRQAKWAKSEEPEEEASTPSQENSLRAANPDILVAKMRPGQIIELEAHAVKGQGGDHAKFSPVATATYRLLPKIDIIKPILGDDARKFARCFPKGVIGLENVSESDAESGGAYAGMEGKKKAVVKDPFKDTVSRECLRHEEFSGKVKLGRVQDHFIFSVESTGQYESAWLFIQSVKALKEKCRDLKRDLGGIVR